MNKRSRTWEADVNTIIEHAKSDAATLDEDFYDAPEHQCLITKVKLIDGDGFIRQMIGAAVLVEFPGFEGKWPGTVDSWNAEYSKFVANFTGRNGEPDSWAFMSLESVLQAQVDISGCKHGCGFENSNDGQSMPAASSTRKAINARSAPFKPEVMVSQSPTATKTPCVVSCPKCECKFESLEETERHQSICMDGDTTIPCRAGTMIPFDWSSDAGIAIATKVVKDEDEAIMIPETVEGADCTVDIQSNSPCIYNCVVCNREFENDDDYLFHEASCLKDNVSIPCEAGSMHPFDMYSIHGVKIARSVLKDIQARRMRTAAVASVAAAVESQTSPVNSPDFDVYTPRMANTVSRRRLNNTNSSECQDIEHQPGPSQWETGIGFESGSVEQKLHLWSKPLTDDFQRLNLDDSLRDKMYFTGYTPRVASTVPRVKLNNTNSSECQDIEHQPGPSQGKDGVVMSLEAPEFLMGEAARCMKNACLRIADLLAIAEVGMTFYEVTTRTVLSNHIGLSSAASARERMTTLLAILTVDNHKLWKAATIAMSSYQKCLTMESGIIAFTGALFQILKRCLNIENIWRHCENHCINPFSDGVAKFREDIRNAKSHWMACSSGSKGGIYGVETRDSSSTSEECEAWPDNKAMVESQRIAMGTPPTELDALDCLRNTGPHYPTIEKRQNMDAVEDVFSDEEIEWGVSKHTEEQGILHPLICQFSKVPNEIRWVFDSKQGISLAKVASASSLNSVEPGFHTPSPTKTGAEGGATSFTPQMFGSPSVNVSSRFEGFRLPMDIPGFTEHLASYVRADRGEVVDFASELSKPSMKSRAEEFVLDVIKKVYGTMMKDRSQQESQIPLHDLVSSLSATGILMFLVPHVKRGPSAVLDQAVETLTRTVSTDPTESESGSMTARLWAKAFLHSIMYNADDIHTPAERRGVWLNGQSTEADLFRLMLLGAVKPTFDWETKSSANDWWFYNRSNLSDQFEIIGYELAKVTFEDSSAPDYLSKDIFTMMHDACATAVILTDSDLWDDTIRIPYSVCLGIYSYVTRQIELMGDAAVQVTGYDGRKVTEMEAFLAGNLRIFLESYTHRENKDPRSKAAVRFVKRYIDATVFTTDSGIDCWLDHNCSKLMLVSGTPEFMLSYERTVTDTLALVTEFIEVTMAVRNQELIPVQKSIGKQMQEQVDYAVQCMSSSLPGWSVEFENVGCMQAVIDRIPVIKCMQKLALIWSLPSTRTTSLNNVSLIGCSHHVECEAYVAVLFVLSQRSGGGFETPALRRLLKNAMSVLSKNTVGKPELDALRVFRADNASLQPDPCLRCFCTNQDDCLRNTVNTRFFDEKVQRTDIQSMAAPLAVAEWNRSNGLINTLVNSYNDTQPKDGQMRLCEDGEKDGWCFATMLLDCFHARFQYLPEKKGKPMQTPDSRMVAYSTVFAILSQALNGYEQYAGPEFIDKLNAVFGFRVIYFVNTTLWNEENSWSLEFQRAGCPVSEAHEALFWAYMDPSWDHHSPCFRWDSRGKRVGHWRSFTRSAADLQRRLDTIGLSPTELLARVQDVFSKDFSFQEFSRNAPEGGYLKWKGFVHAPFVSAEQLVDVVRCLTHKVVKDGMPFWAIRNLAGLVDVELVLWVPRDFLRNHHGSSALRQAVELLQVKGASEHLGNGCDTVIPLIAGQSGGRQGTLLRPREMIVLIPGSPGHVMFVHLPSQRQLLNTQGAMVRNAAKKRRRPFDGEEKRVESSMITISRGCMSPLELDLSKPGVMAWLQDYNDNVSSALQGSRYSGLHVTVQQERGLFDYARVCFSARMNCFALFESKAFKQCRAGVSLGVGFEKGIGSNQDSASVTISNTTEELQAFFEKMSRDAPGLRPEIIRRSRDPRRQQDPLHSDHMRSEHAYRCPGEVILRAIPADYSVIFTTPTGTFVCEKQDKSQKDKRVWVVEFVLFSSDLNTVGHMQVTNNSIDVWNSRLIGSKISDDRSMLGDLMAGSWFGMESEDDAGGTVTEDDGAQRCIRAQVSCIPEGPSREQLTNDLMTVFAVLLKNNGGQSPVELLRETWLNLLTSRGAIEFMKRLKGSSHFVMYTDTDAVSLETRSHNDFSTTRRVTTGASWSSVLLGGTVPKAPNLVPMVVASGQVHQQEYKTSDEISVENALNNNMMMENRSNGARPVVVMGRACDLVGSARHTLTGAELIAVMYGITSGDWMEVLDQSTLSPFQIITHKDDFLNVRLSLNCYSGTQEHVALEFNNWHKILQTSQRKNPAEVQQDYDYFIEKIKAVQEVRMKALEDASGDKLWELARRYLKNRIARRRAGMVSLSYKMALARLEESAGSSAEEIPINTSNGNPVEVTLGCGLGVTTPPLMTKSMLKEVKAVDDEVQQVCLDTMNEVSALQDEIQVLKKRVADLKVVRSEDSLLIKVEAQEAEITRLKEVITEHADLATEAAAAAEDLHTRLKEELAECQIDLQLAELAAVTADSDRAAASVLRLASADLYTALEGQLSECQAELEEALSSAESRESDSREVDLGRSQQQLLDNLETQGAQHERQVGIVLQELHATQASLRTVEERYTELQESVPCAGEQEVEQWQINGDALQAEEELRQLVTQLSTQLGELTGDSNYIEVFEKSPNKDPARVLAELTSLVTKHKKRLSHGNARQGSLAHQQATTSGPARMEAIDQLHYLVSLHQDGSEAAMEAYFSDLKTEGADDWFDVMAGVLGGLDIASIRANFKDACTFTTVKPGKGYKTISQKKAAIFKVEKAMSSTFQEYGKNYPRAQSLTDLENNVARLWEYVNDAVGALAEGDESSSFAGNGVENVQTPAARISEVMKLIAGNTKRIKDTEEATQLICRMAVLTWFQDNRKSDLTNWDSPLRRKNLELVRQMEKQKKTFQKKAETVELEITAAVSAKVRLEQQLALETEMCVDYRVEVEQAQATHQVQQSELAAQALKLVELQGLLDSEKQRDQRDLTVTRDENSTSLQTQSMQMSDLQEKEYQNAQATPSLIASLIEVNDKLVKKSVSCAAAQGLVEKLESDLRSHQSQVRSLSEEHDIQSEQIELQKDKLALVQGELVALQTMYDQMKQLNITNQQQAEQRTIVVQESLQSQGVSLKTSQSEVLQERGEKALLVASVEEYKELLKVASEREVLARDAELQSHSEARDAEIALGASLRSEALAQESQKVAESSLENSVRNTDQLQTSLRAELEKARSSAGAELIKSLMAQELNLSSIHQLGREITQLKADLTTQQMEATLNTETRQIEQNRQMDSMVQLKDDATRGLDRLEENNVALNDQLETSRAKIADLTQDVNVAITEAAYMRNRAVNHTASLGMSHETGGGQTSRSASLVSNPSLNAEFASRIDIKPDVAWIVGPASPTRDPHTGEAVEDYRVEGIILDVTHHELQVMLLSPDDPRDCRFETFDTEEFMRSITENGGFFTTEDNLLGSHDDDGTERSPGFGIDIAVLDEIKGYVRSAMSSLIPRTSKCYGLQLKELRRFKEIESTIHQFEKEDMVYIRHTHQGVQTRFPGYITVDSEGFFSPPEDPQFCFVELLDLAVVRHERTSTFHIAVTCNQGCHNTRSNPSARQSLSGSCVAQFFTQGTPRTPHTSHRGGQRKPRQSTPYHHATPRQQAGLLWSESALNDLQKKWYSMTRNWEWGDITKKSMNHLGGNHFVHARRLYTILKENSIHVQAVQYLLGSMSGSSDLEQCIMRRFESGTNGCSGEPKNGLSSIEAMRLLFLDCTGTDLSKRTAEMEQRDWYLISHPKGDDHCQWTYGDAADKLDNEAHRMATAFSVLPRTWSDVKMYLECTIGKTGLPISMFEANMCIWEQLYNRSTDGPTYLEKVIADFKELIETGPHSIYSRWIAFLSFNGSVADRDSFLEYKGKGRRTQKFGASETSPVAKTVDRISNRPPRNGRGLRQAQINHMRGNEEVGNIFANRQVEQNVMDQMKYDSEEAALPHKANKCRHHQLLIEKSKKAQNPDFDMVAALETLHTEGECIDWRNPRLACSVLGNPKGIKRIQWIYRAPTEEEGRRRWRMVQDEIRDEADGEIHCIIFNESEIEFSSDDSYV